ncbi:MULTISPECIES: hypothetical protein [unclassified Ensifer]|uniref:hypothetical protein n=1 Tax=unclassified Ensifer TaxID=2633371 RepID=UPI000813C1A4|nr:MULTISPECIES: hypothetical protein [unclassified Ensifer]OCP00747.1 hypothetical protein BC362_23830 [Ensifer sp. LC14]OCP04605.1 hypothetical protein BBX50_25315 [Ensifer sp. LC11]OCP09658.1 hypothetical protein BC374_03705 [Ensifer sp. LC13]OCP30704.1 hypothetical protein BC364_24995 [Ensifer sp. LC499]
MVKNVRKTTGRVADAAIRREIFRDKAGVFHERLKHNTEVISQTTPGTVRPAANLRPQTVVVKQEQPPVAASGDETYDVSMKAAEDVFARFDWTLAELAK